MLVIVHAASGERRSHAIVVGIDEVEADESRAGALVDAVLPLPLAAPEPAPLPVDGV